MNLTLPKTIGVIHFSHLLGSDKTEEMDIALKNALQDLLAFEEGGMEAVIIENNYDLPHRMTVLPETAEAVLFLGKCIREATKLTMGVCVLWNDYQAAFSIAKSIGAQFVRIPTFVDRVRSEYGIAEPCSQDALQFRSAIGAEHIAILADVHVKHAELLSSMTLAESVQMAIEQDASGIIVTGKWTGDPPLLEDLQTAKQHAGGNMVFAGSGVSEHNAHDILKFADGIIVSTSLKEKGSAHRQNIVGPDRRIQRDKVRALISSIHTSQSQT